MNTHNIPASCPLTDVDITVLVDNQTREEIHGVRTAIDLLKHDMSALDRYVIKMDLTIEKLTQSNESISKLLALHEERIETNRSEEVKCTTILNTHRKQIRQLELWRYLIVGGAIVFGFFINAIILDNNHRTVFSHPTTTTEETTPAHK